MIASSTVRVLAVASLGSRWAELNAIVRAIGSDSAVLVCASNPAAPLEPFGKVVADFSLLDPWKLPVCAAQLLWLTGRLRPQLVISTGAAPGVLALAMGRLFGARCVWVESLTSTEGSSLSGRIAGKLADLWLTQWPELARADGPHYVGAVL